MEDSTEDTNAITPKDLMKFLQQMSRKMDNNKETLEEKIDKTNNKIDKKFGVMDEEIKDMREKIEESKEVNTRMNERLIALEKEVLKSQAINRRTNKLKNTLNIESEERRESDSQNEVCQPEDEMMEKGAERSRTQKTFRSEWAKKMEADLENAANKAKNMNEKRIVDKEKEKRSLMREKEEMDREEARRRPMMRDEEEMDREEYRRRPMVREEWKEKVGGTDDDGWQERRDIPKSWEEILQGDIKKATRKVRKPPKITEWFGILTES